MRKRYRGGDDVSQIVGPYIQPLVVFDGDCVLCSRSMRMLVKLDKARRFHLTPAQGDLGRSLYRACDLSTDNFATYLVVADNRVFERSTAIVAIAKRLAWPWKAGAALIIVPRPIRDALYDLVARHRYRIFGRRDACGIKDAALQDRLV